MVLSDILPAVAETAADIIEAGGEAEYLVADISRSDNGKALVDLAVDKFGRLDFAFNNAGISGEDGRTPQQVIDSIDSSGWKEDPSQYGMTAMEYQMAIAEQFFQKQIDRAGGLNQWNHFPALAKAADKWVVSPNIDTMFSLAIVDAPQGFTVPLPEVGERFISLHINDQHHTAVDYTWRSGKHSYRGGRILRRIAFL